MRLGEIVLDKARAIPDRAAIVFRDQTMTYGELAVAIQQFAAALLELGVNTGDRIALLLPNCPPFLVGYFAGTIIDVVVVPANPLLKPAELEYIWADAAIRLVVTIPQLLPIVQAARTQLPALDYVVCIAPRSESGPLELTESIRGFISLDELLASGANALGRSPGNTLETAGKGR